MVAIFTKDSDFSENEKLNIIRQSTVCLEQIPGTKHFIVLKNRYSGVTSSNIVLEYDFTDPKTYLAQSD